jgi:hypothetical protein
MIWRAHEMQDVNLDPKLESCIGTSPIGLAVGPKPAMYPPLTSLKLSRLRFTNVEAHAPSLETKSLGTPLR